MKIGYIHSVTNVVKTYPLQILLLFVALSTGGCGNDLNRSSAENKIKESLRDEKITQELELGNEKGIIRYSWPSEYYYGKAHAQNSLGDYFVSDHRKLLTLAEKGLLTYKTVTTHHDDAAERSPGDTARFYYDEYMLELTPKAKEYVVKEEMKQAWGRHTKVVTVLLAELDKLEVTGISKPSEGLGQKMSVANYTMHYKATPFGEIFMKNNEALKQERQAGFVLYDDGWRLTR